MPAFIFGRSLRLTGYACGLSFGLALLAVGVNGAWMAVIGDLPRSLTLLYTSIALVLGILFAFVIGYLNGGLLASWAFGTVPAAGRLSGALIDGSVRNVLIEAIGALGIGVLLGAVGFGLAVEKHRSDQRTADLPAPPSRKTLIVAIALSVVVGSILLSSYLFVGAHRLAFRV
jgi:hypothetical protein